MGYSCVIVSINTVAHKFKVVYEFLHTTCSGSSSHSIQRSPYMCTSLPIRYSSVILT